MNTPLAKRRRLDEATRTLHKPFKSPFRTPLKASTSPSEPPSSDPPEAPKNDLSSTKTNATQNRPLHDPTLVVTPRSPTTTPSRPIQRKALPSLTREIIQLRSDIQILTQALTLVTSDKDRELQRLIDTWRTASRAAAEDLFARTRDRVNRMGGVAAWREREKEQKEWRKKWDREEMEAERARWEEEKGDEDNARFDDYEYGGGEGEEMEKQEEVGPNDDQSFTMGMMLNTLNVGLKLIGYDNTSQRWEG
ncbi:uncharacterized protein EI97DRAFT_375755 [Westerdykella ornata]|uniref:Swi5-domain-containing protein n=1 Tax=Westerdykella ornata TaxID=318751 RepID=A0A6A6JJZ3_WESOR|nr:uncharacterized protein EI97DRAFT_375755 [Westerdykella ornata]KAF2276960.1 hypothetical protein EI97DRAFT_375755 [Westerdykella ornata]